MHMLVSTLRVAMFLSVLATGPAFAADEPPCELLTRPQVATVVGEGTIGTQYGLEDLPQRRAKGREPTPIDVCVWSVRETQSVVEVHLVVAPPDRELALATLGEHGRRHRDDEQEFGAVSCWSETLPKPQFPSAACVGNVKGNTLKVLFRSKTAKPTIRHAKSLFDLAAAGL
jgi:hypothetical protein